MVTGKNTAYRCQECNELFLKPTSDKVLTPLKKLFGLVVCPRCGSRKVIELPFVKT
jgi:DNA-directed RNA polymerase subunit RPC12/RpoP